MAQMMKDNFKISPISNEQKKVIEKLEEVLLFLKSTPIKNDEALTFVKKPLSDLQSNLKYLPTEQSFKNFPAEIKRKTLDYLCDSHAFIAASVCQEWREIFESRFADKAVTIGERCCAKKCRDHMGFRRSEKACQMLKALATHRLDVDLSITHPIKQIDSKIVTRALTSVSKFTISGENNCTCQYENGYYRLDSDSDSAECECDLNPLTLQQLQDLFHALEKKDAIVEKVKLVDMDLNNLDQDRLANCFLNKIKNLKLEGVTFKDEIFFRKLSEEPTRSTEFQLTSLTFQGTIVDELCNYSVSPLCNIESVTFGDHFYHESDVVKQLIENIVTLSHPVKINTLIISTLDFRSLINLEDMERLFNKMVKLQLRGIFTLAQVEAVRFLPGVEVSGINEYEPDSTVTGVIQKGF